MKKENLIRELGLFKSYWINMPLSLKIDSVLTLTLWFIAILIIIIVFNNKI